MSLVVTFNGCTLIITNTCTFIVINSSLLKRATKTNGGVWIIPVFFNRKMIDLSVIFVANKSLANESTLGRGVKALAESGKKVWVGH